MLMSKKSALAAAVGALMAIGAQAKSRDPGPPDHRQLTPGNFDRIAVAGPFVVRVQTGKLAGVSLSGPRTMLDDTDLDVQDGELRIRWQEGASWSRNGNEGVDVDITMPVIRSVTNVGAGSIDIDTVEGDRFLARLVSAGGVTIHSMDVDQLKAVVAGAGSLGLTQIKAKAVDVDLAGAGAMRATGRAETANVRLAGSGSFDSANFAARDASILSQGSGTIRTSVTDKADIKAMGSGGVVVTGGAKCTVRAAGSGKVRCS
jgi:hypothetical protein